MSSQNKYVVTWDIFANTETAVTNIRSFTTTVNRQNAALKTGIEHLAAYNKQLMLLRNNMRKVGGVMSSTGRLAVGQGAGAFPNTKASRGYAGWGNMMMPPYAATPVISNSRLNEIAKKQQAASAKAASKASTRGMVRGAAASRAGFSSPLKGTPFGGLMGTLLAYSAISSNVVQASEYNNLMTTAKSFLRVADEDLTTFEDRFDKLAKNVRQVGLETKFTATQVAGATKYLAMAGMDVNTINQSIKPIADLALIGDEELALIADLSTNIMTGYGLDSGAMSSVSDIISSTMTRSNVSITEVAESFKMAAGYLSASGVDFSEATAAIGVLGDAGMKATLAGTAMRAMMIRFAKPTTQAKKVMEGFGVSFTETVDVMGESVTKVRPLIDIFTELKAKGAGLEDLQRMFGTIGGNAALQLLNRTDKLGELTRQNRFSHGTSEFLAEEKKNTTVGLWHQMVSKFQDQFLVSFERLAPSISETLRAITASFESDSFVNGLENLGRGLLSLTETATKLGIWVGENWNWLQPLIVGKFIYSNLTNLANGIIGVGSSLKGIVSGGAGIAAVAGGWVTLVAALTAGAVALSIDAHNIKVSNDRIVKSIKDTTPTVSTNINAWSEAVKGFRTELIGVDGTIGDIQDKLGVGKSVKDFTGVAGEKGFLGFKSDANIVGTSKKQIEAYLGMQQTSLYNALFGDLKKLDINDENYTEQVDKIVEAVTERYDVSGIPIDKSLYKAILLPLHENPNYSDYSLPEAQKEFKTYEAWARAMRESEIGLPIQYRSYIGITKDLSDSPADVIKTTREYQYGMSEFKDNLIKNIVAPWKGWMSSADSARNSVIGMMGEGELEFLRSKGILQNGVFTNNLKGLELDKADMIRSRNIIQSFINDSVMKMPDGSKAGLDKGLIAELLSKAGVPAQLWGSDPLNINGTNITSGLDDEGNEGGSKKGISGASNQPRQVIVNLDNLLNIEMVEIDNSNQDIEIASIKEKLAQALLDVVADYSAAYHG